VQAKLLRLLESGEYRPVGSEEGNKYANLRIIGAGQNKLVNNSDKLRGDLKARIAQLSVQLNPLEKLGEEIIIKICTALLERYSFTSISSKDGEDKKLSPKKIREYQDKLRDSSRKNLLLRNGWKESNIRELNNFLRHWLVFGDEEFYQLKQKLGAEDVKITVSESNGNSKEISIKDYGDFAPYLGPFNDENDISTIFKENPFENAVKAYVNYLFDRYNHMGIDEKEPRKRKTKKEFARRIGSTESKLRNLLKKNSEQ
jgi:DNA-binding NtrC family response regulator